jgi:small-conductance mechanosensitive channel
MSAAISRPRIGGLGEQGLARGTETGRVVELDIPSRGDAALDRTGRQEADAAHDWGQTLHMVHRASELLRAAEERVRELENSNRELAERAAMQAEVLQGRVLQAQVRAEEAEQRRKEAEEWLRRIHNAIAENLSP